MSKYQSKRKIVDAVQWFGHGDHPEVIRITGFGHITPVAGGWIKGWSREAGDYVPVRRGDWILEFEDGHFEKKTDEEFKAEFEPWLEFESWTLIDKSALRAIMEEST